MVGSRCHRQRTRPSHRRRAGHCRPVQLEYTRCGPAGTCCRSTPA